jgi:RNA polymerase subunit RPABC4/transcription elongation factor Spt4
MKQNEKPKKTETCPYCDEEIAKTAAPFCRPCKVELRYCKKCKSVVEKKAKKCPQCGESLE